MIAREDTGPSVLGRISFEANEHWLYHLTFTQGGYYETLWGANRPRRSSPLWLPTGRVQKPFAKSSRRRKPIESGSRLPTLPSVEPYSPTIRFSAANWSPCSQRARRWCWSIGADMQGLKAKLRPPWQEDQSRDHRRWSYSGPRPFTA